MAVPAIPAWVSDALGIGASDLHRIPWGFTNETWAGTDLEGTVHVATLIDPPARAADLLARAPRLAEALARVGLDTPVPIPARSDPRRGVIVAPWMDGVPGMMALGGPDGAQNVGLAAGAAWRRLRDADTAVLALDDLWARPTTLATAARGWLARAEGSLGSSHAAAVARRIDDIAASSRGAIASFVHGDFVPANLLLRDGRLPCILDLETVRMGDPLVDAAWFSWIVRHHHPEAWPTAWSAFSQAAGIGHVDNSVRALMLALPTARILENLADPALAPRSRDQWLAQLRAIAETTDISS
jgi:aminoglycoside phosphotransferase (APT) family kinase protein